MTRITVACLDMAGTTVADDGSVLAAFSAAIGAQLSGAAYEQALSYARSTMGQSKISVFRAILGSSEAAEAANAAFESHYALAIRGGQVAPLPGASAAIEELRAAGVKVCLATGFSPATRDAILDVLGWGSIADLFLSPADVGFGGAPGRGRPYPDLPLTALLRLGGEAVSELAVAGDTPSDIESGLRAGAGVVAGVLTGTGSRLDLEAAGAPVILDSISGLLEVISPG